LLKNLENGSFALEDLIHPSKVKLAKIKAAAKWYHNIKKYRLYHVIMIPF
jgi:hypothetical protein